MPVLNGEQMSTSIASFFDRLLVFLAPQPLPRLRSLNFFPWLVVGTVCIGAFMGQLDVGVVSLVLPTLEKQFHTSLGAVQWTAVAYLLVLTGLLMPLGYFSDRMGRKAMYILGFIVFTGGSALCAVSPNLVMLIIARVLQAVGAAMLQSNSVAIITAAMPRDKLGRGIGVQGTAQALGLAFGPALGGFLIDWLGWRSVFLINVPIGIFAVLLARYTLPRRDTRPKYQPLNQASVLLLPSGTAALLLGMTFLNHLLLWVALSVALFVAFVHIERRAQTPLFSRDVLEAPGLLAGTAAALLSYTVLFGALLAISLMLERVFGESAAKAGSVLSILPISLAMVAQLGGVMRDRVGRRLPTVIGMLLATLGLAALWWTGPGRFAWIYAGLGILGVGIGLFIPANNAGLMAAAPSARLGLVSGLINMMRGLGASLGVALVSLFLALHLGAQTHVAPTQTILARLRLTILVLAGAALLTAWLSALGGPDSKVDNSPVDGSIA